MQRFLCLLLCLPLLATSACAADAIAGPGPVAPAPAAGPELESELQAAKAAAPAPESSPPTLVFRCGTSVSVRTDAPLYIIDGAITSDDDALAQLDADVIVSIEVIKGADAAALYGSRAAAGVIIVTTRGARPRPAGR